MNKARIKNFSLIGLFVLAAISALFALNIGFRYDFEQFLPQGDEDLDFFYSFREQFEADDNFLLIAIEHDRSIFQPNFLFRVDSLTKQLSALEHIKTANSLTNFNYFIKSAFGISKYPAIHINDLTKLDKDSIKLSNDPRMVGLLIDEQHRSVVIACKTVDTITQANSNVLLEDIQSMLDHLSFENTHIIGKAYFQDILVRLQQKEFVKSTVVSLLLVMLITFLVYRRFVTVAITLMAVSLALVFFLGYLGFFSYQLDVLSVLYPVLIIIVGVSDVVHLMGKYIAELRKGVDRNDAIKTTVKQIGLATFLTSLTTAIGFLTLVSSKVPPVRLFGVTAAIGIILTFLVTLVFFYLVLPRFKLDQLVKGSKSIDSFLNPFLERLYQFTINSRAAIVASSIVFLVFTAYGISRISMDQVLSETLPESEGVRAGFDFFEEHYAGFRPLEIAVTPKSNISIYDPQVVRVVDSVERLIDEYAIVNNVRSYTKLYKNLNMAENANRFEYYRLPDSDKKLKKYQRYIDQLGGLNDVLISKDGKQLRIAAQVKDVGSDSIFKVSESIDKQIAKIGTKVVDYRQTGTGLILEKNNEYLRKNLVQGLFIAILSISIIMALLFKNARFVLISLVPNLVPLFVGGAMLGYFQIALDAPMSIIFAISFGIAVDDSIHFLSKLKLEYNRHGNIEQAVKTTFQETGKAIIITSIILFFGFLVLLFSAAPGSRHVGFLISFTLLSAMVADLLILPILIRYLIKNKVD